MSGTTDKVKGAGNEIIGGAKRNLGEAVGSDKLQAKGIAQEVKGQVQKAVGDAKSTVKDATKKIDDDADRDL